jgi:xylan 1,4-beta-xylosidase
VSHLDINPVLAGFHPDPSVCRVGDEFFVVTSTFAYFPGIPVHSSRDLVNWERVGHVLADPDHVDLDGLDVSDGVWAPTIRHFDGVFFVVYTVAENRQGRGTFVSTAPDAAGPWTAPVALDADGIDPSLFFDDDGRCWFTAARDATAPEATGPAEIYIREFDWAGLRLIGDETVIWHGALTGQWVEAPHIYRRGETYYLIAAEGGTERNHSVTAATATAPAGPYRTDPRSPLLTHRHLGARAPVQNVGHADLVETADGVTWALVLGVRQRDGVHTLGRESFLVPVEWEPEGPVFAPGVGALAGSTGGFAPEADWLTLRGPVAHRWSGADLHLPSSPAPLTGLQRPSFLGRRQDRHRFAFSASVRAPLEYDHESSLVAFQGQGRFVRITVRRTPASVVVETWSCTDGRETLLDRRVGSGWQRLEVRSDGFEYLFGTSQLGSFEEHARLPSRALSTEDSGGFVGVVLGVGHAGPAGSTAVFADVRYGTLDDAVARKDAIPHAAAARDSSGRALSTAEQTSY